MKDPIDQKTIDAIQMLDEQDQAAAKMGLEEAKRPRGRPRQHGSNAEKQKAYRARLKEKGMRVVSKVVRDVRRGQPLESSVIDLSAVRRWA